MKIKKEVYLRSIGGDSVLIPIGKTVEEFNGIFELTPVGAVIFAAIERGEEKDGILEAVLAEFDVEPAAAEKDIDEFLEKLSFFGII